MREGDTSTASENAVETDDETLTEEVMSEEENTDSTILEDTEPEPGEIPAEGSETLPEEGLPVIQEAPETGDGQVTDEPAVAMMAANEDFTGC